jgi:hypothetical protein
VIENISRIFYVGVDQSRWPGKLLRDKRFHSVSRG